MLYISVRYSYTLLQSQRSFIRCVTLCAFVHNQTVGVNWTATLVTSLGLSCLECQCCVIKTHKVIVTSLPPEPVLLFFSRTAPWFRCYAKRSAGRFRALFKFLHIPRLQKQCVGKKIVLFFSGEKIYDLKFCLFAAEHFWGDFGSTLSSLLVKEISMTRSCPELVWAQGCFLVQRYVYDVLQTGSSIRQAMLQHIWVWVSLISFPLLLLTQQPKSRNFCYAGHISPQLFKISKLLKTRKAINVNWSIA